MIVPMSRVRAAILDYGVGNIHSISKALAVAGADVTFVREPLAALSSDMLVLPGVGSFSAAARQIAADRNAIRDALNGGLACLGICLGMQLLMDASDEGPGRGISFFEGEVKRIRAGRVPHMGWNQIETDPGAAANHLSIGGVALGSSGLNEAYFAHSYVCRPVDSTVPLAWTSYDEDRFPAVVARHRTTGVQFHPEKSGPLGLRFLAAIVDGVRRSVVGTPANSSIAIPAGARR